MRDMLYMALVFKNQILSRISRCSISRNFKGFLRGKKVCHPRGCSLASARILREAQGQLAEWSNAHAWKACEAAMSPRVRIPPCPPLDPSSVHLGWGLVFWGGVRTRFERTAKRRASRPISTLEMHKAFLPTSTASKRSDRQSRPVRHDSRIDNRVYTKIGGLHQSLNDNAHTCLFTLSL